MQRFITIEFINTVAPLAGDLRTSLLALENTLVFHHGLIAMGVRESQIVVKG